MTIQKPFKQRVDTILQKEVDRKHFLKIAAVGIFVASSLGTLIQLFLRIKPATAKPVEKDQTPINYGGK